MDELVYSSGEFLPDTTSWTNAMEFSLFHRHARICLLLCTRELNLLARWGTQRGFKLKFGM